MTPDANAKPEPIELIRQARSALVDAALHADEAIKSNHRANEAIELADSKLCHLQRQICAGGLLFVTADAGEPLTAPHRDLDAMSRVADALAAFRESHPDDETDAAHLYANICGHATHLWGLVMAGEGNRTRAQLQSAATLLAAHAVRFLADFADRANPVTDDMMTAMGQADRAANAKLASEARA